MKKYAVPVLITILIVLQILSISRIGNLQNDLRNAENNLLNIVSEQSNEISDIYSNIDSMLKRQSSIIDSYEYSFGMPDKDKLTVPVTFTLSPKESRVDTSATLHVSGKSVTMSRNGTNFTGTLSVDLFDTMEAKVVIADNGLEKTEKLEVEGNLRHSLLPTIFAHFEGESGSEYSTKPGDLTGEYHRKGNLSVDVKSSKENTIEKASLVIEIDGKVISEKPINIDGQCTDINEKVPLSAGQTLIMSVMATDNIDLIHKAIIDKFELDDNAVPVYGDEWMWMDDNIITDKNGKVLYEPNYDQLNE